MSWQYSFPLIPLVGLVLLPCRADAETLFTVEAGDFPPSVDPATISGTATVQGFSGFPLEVVDCAVSGPDASDQMRFLIQADHLFPVSAALITELSVSFPCLGETQTAVESYAPFSFFYFPGPALPPSAPTSFDIDSEQFCGGHITGSFLTETFDHGGSLPAGWITDAPSRTSAWSAVLVDGSDYAARSVYTAPDSNEERRLRSPGFDLSHVQDVEVGFLQNFAAHGATASLWASTDDGLSWSQQYTLDQDAFGPVYLDLSAIADQCPAFRLEFRFDPASSAGASSWQIDDLVVNAVATPPLASQPVPAQPPGIWADRFGEVGCLWQHPAFAIDGSQVEVRIDRDGDGAYGPAPEEDFIALPSMSDGSPLAVTRLIEDLSDGVHLFEFRARATENGAWGYSGNSGLEGPADDWYVEVLSDQDPPVFSAYLPAGQPEPSWVASRTQTAGALVQDDGSGLEPFSIWIRVDGNGNGVFGSGEHWESLGEIPGGSAYTISEELSFDLDGEFLFQFHAEDLQGNEAFSEMLKIRVDTTPPQQPVLAVLQVEETAHTLTFLPSTEANFARYEIAVSLDSLADGNDMLWSTMQDPALGVQETSEAVISGLLPGTPYWYSLRVIDLAGNVSPWSNTVSPGDNGVPLGPVRDFAIQVLENGVQLDWSAPTVDFQGLPPVHVEGYDVYASSVPWFSEGEGTFLGSLAAPGLLAPLPPDNAHFYRIVAHGFGLSPPPPGLLPVPAGSFTMGPDPLGDGVAHTVQLTRPFWLGEHEVTNAEYMQALQWAFDQGGLLGIDANTVVLRGREVLDLDNTAYGGCEIRFNFQDEVFYLEERDETVSGSWGPGIAYPDGYDPAQMPVKLVTWHGAAGYCDLLNMMQGYDPIYLVDNMWNDNLPTPDPHQHSGYRLPTEAEWEYAARYDDGRLFPWGNNAPVACEPLSNSELCLGWTWPVGSEASGNSALGLADMAGNLLEWCHDWHEDGYPGGDASNPYGPDLGSRRVLRGGDFGAAPILYSQSTTRQRSLPYEARSWIGFRVAFQVND